MLHLASVDLHHGLRLGIVKGDSAYHGIQKNRLDCRRRLFLSIVVIYGVIFFLLFLESLLPRPRQRVDVKLG